MSPTFNVTYIHRPFAGYVWQATEKVRQRVIAIFGVTIAVWTL